MTAQMALNFGMLSRTGPQDVQVADAQLAQICILYELYASDCTCRHKNLGIIDSIQQRVAVRMRIDRQPNAAIVQEHYLDSLRGPVARYKKHVILIGDTCRDTRVANEHLNSIAMSIP